MYLLEIDEAGEGGRMGKIDGRVAIVTGAAMGNGEGIARILAKHGAHVVLWDISEKVFNTADSLKSK